MHAIDIDSKKQLTLENYPMGCFQMFSKITFNQAQPLSWYLFDIKKEKRNGYGWKKKVKKQGTCKEMIEKETDLLKCRLD